MKKFTFKLITLLAIIIAITCTGLQTVWAQTWNIKYEANALPGNSSPAWSSYLVGAATQSVNNGILTLTSGVDWPGYWLTTAYSSSTVESSFKVNSGTARLSVSTGSEVINIDYPADPIPKFHTLRITLTNTEYKYYMDNVFVCSGQPVSQTGKWPVMFCAGSNSNVNWDYVYYTSGVFAPFSFVHITDLHVAASASAGEYDLDGVAFGRMISKIDALSPKPGFVVATGDICHAGEWSSAQYPDVIQRLFPSTALTNPGVGAYYADAARTIPMYFTTGNHDYRETNTPPTSDYSPEYFPGQLGPLGDYVIDKGDAVLIGLNSGYDQTRTGDIMKPEGSGLTNNQITWLTTQLAAAGSKRKIIFMHHPAVAVRGTLWNEQLHPVPPQNLGDGTICTNVTNFLNLCDTYSVDVVLTGHEHQNVVCDRNGTLQDENWTGGTRYIQTAEGFRGCYRTITVDGNGVTVSEAKIFPDLPTNHWAYANIMYLYDRGVVSGYPDGTFGPENNVTRAQLATMMKQALNLPDYTGGLTDYPDVPPTHWAYPYIMSAKQNNIMGGYPDGRFGPENNALRSEISCVISIAKNWTYDGGLTDFPDVPPTHWAYSYIMSCKQEGVITGYPNGNFGPDYNVTRAEAATMIAKMMQWTAKSATEITDTTGVTGINESVVPDNYFNLNSYPNPFSSTVTIEYSLPKADNVSIAVYNIAGQLVSTLVNEEKPAGKYSVVWNGKDAGGNELSSGVYYCNMVTNKFAKTSKLLFMKE